MGRQTPTVVETTITFNYTTTLNVIFIGVAALPVRRFLKTGGPKMLKMMKMSSHDLQRMGHHGGNRGHAHGG